MVPISESKRSKGNHRLWGDRGWSNLRLQTERLEDGGGDPVVGNRWLGRWRPVPNHLPLSSSSSFEDPSAATLVRFLKKIQIFSTFFLVCSLHLLSTVLLHKTHQFFQPSPDFSKRSKYYQLAFPPSSLKSLLFACSPSSTDPPRFRKETNQIHN